MSACSAVCASLMNSAQVVCIDQRLTMPSRTPEVSTTLAIRSVRSTSSTRSAGLDAERLGADDEPAAGSHVAGRRLPDVDSRALAHRLQSSYGPLGWRPQKLNFTGAILSDTTDDGAATPGGSARRSREVGANPTRCRHCKRGVLIPCGGLSRPAATVHLRRMGRRESSDDPRARIPDAGPSFPRRETRRKGAPCILCSFAFPSLPYSSPRQLHVQRGPACVAGPVTGQVVDPDGRACPARPCS